MSARAATAALFCLLAASAAWPACAQTPPTVEEMQALRSELERLRAEDRERAARMDAIERRLNAIEGAPSETAAPARRVAQQAEAATPDPVILAQAQSPEESSVHEEAPEQWGGYFPGPGFVLVRSSIGELDFGLTTYVRYVDQTGYDSTFTDFFGRERDVLRQNNFMLAKGQLNFRGWILDQRLNFLLYTWTQNAAQGQGAQVAVAGNISFKFDDAFELFGGIHSVPSTRTTNRTFPMWLRNDNRTIADEYFRGSYTSGIWAQGFVAPGLQYRVMAANNLSTLGVDAGQLSPGIHTFSGALTWMPTTHEYGPAQGFGDLERHEDFATLFSIHYTRSRENAEAQPGVNDFENTQLHLSDGTLLFSPNAFNTGGQVTEATYQMLDVSAGFKYQGWTLDFEHYWRWIDDFDTVGPVPVDSLYDTGFQLQGSTMLTDQLQAYFSGSMIFGDFGDPSDLALGFNWFPFNRRSFRINGQALYVDGSPVGYLSYILPVGARGWGFNIDASLVF